MKKILALLILLQLFFSALPCFAAPGDIAGQLYFTDIQAYIHHSPITSYNIGGKTVIDAEILNWHYGFDVYWRPETRRLEITDKGGIFESLQARSGSLVESAEGTVGEVFGNYYETDIVTLLNGAPIESYNIGGRTFVVAENMRDFGYIVDWNEEKRTLTITKPSDFYKIETDYGTIKTVENYQTVYDGKVIYQDTASDASNYYRADDRGFLVSDSEGNTFEIKTETNFILYGPYQFNSMRLSDAAKILNAEVSLKESVEISQTEWANGTSYEMKRFSYAIELNFDENVDVEKVPYEGASEFRETQISNVYAIEMPLFVNGEESWFVNPNPKTGGEFIDDILIVDGEIFIPCYTVAKLLSYATGS